MRTVLTFAIFLLFSGVANSATWKLGISSGQGGISWQILSSEHYTFTLSPDIKCISSETLYVENPFDGRVSRSKDLMCSSVSDDFQNARMGIQYSAQGYGDKRDYGCDDMKIYKKGVNYRLYICFGEK